MHVEVVTGKTNDDKYQKFFDELNEYRAEVAMDQARFVLEVVQK